VAKDLNIKGTMKWTGHCTKQGGHDSAWKKKPLNLQIRKVIICAWYFINGMTIVKYFEAMLIKEQGLECNEVMTPCYLYEWIALSTNLQVRELM
jgi:hypothetical protein